MVTARRTTLLALTLLLAAGAAAADHGATGFRRLASGPLELAPHPPVELEGTRVPQRGDGVARKGLPRELALYEFFPQAGRLGRDLFLYNGTDVEPLRGPIRDFECSAYTYDGHHGHDVLVRSFREVEIGVPVFAVLDGSVVETHDGEPDRNVAGDPVASNYVVLDHGGGHATLYFHLARGSVAVAAGDRVVAGQAIGLTASSGNSTWPHLHFESWLDGRWYEPSAGPCSAGPSQWRRQPPIVRDFAVADFYLTAAEVPFLEPLDAAADLDPRLRAGSFPLGTTRLMGRIDLFNLPGGALWRTVLRDPGGRIVLEDTAWSELADPARYWIEVFELVTPFDRLGIWRLQLEMNGSLVLDAPIRIVANARAAANRPPNRIGVTFASAPRAGQVATCEVETSLVHEDPDYDLLRYRYQWIAGKRTVRNVTSAARSDHLRRDLVRAREQLTCKVTPHDGRVGGRAAQARAKVAP
jgi:murein DD-endopeptidase MepM/ murein hydrolase activator NlpD